jgi:hypothetical protein
MSRGVDPVSAHWHVEYDRGPYPYAIPCNCHVEEDHDETRPVSVRDEAVRFINLELQTRPDHDLAPIVPAVVDILIGNPDVLVSLIVEGTR